jgi:MFS family permease
MYRASKVLNKTTNWISLLMVGGTWGDSLIHQVKQNLRWFWLDGLYASASDNISATFISLYILSLGATQGQIGLMNSISNFTGALLLLPGALLAEKIVNRKYICLTCGGGMSRLALLMLVFVPILFKGSGLIWIAIALSVAKDAFGNLSYPAWVSITNDIVPIDGRGRYFGARNFVMSITGMVSVLLAGKLITLFVSQIGYQIALGLAFVLGAMSTYSYAHINEPIQSSINRDGAHLDLRQFFQGLKTQPQFVALIITTAFWNLTVNIASPFFGVYMVENLSFTAAIVGLLSVVSSISALFFQNRLGVLSDRWGSHRVQLISMILIPLIPFACILVSKPWHVVVINIFNGVFWAAFNLASFNLMLESIPTDQVPRSSAIYQIIVTISLSIGALIGSGIITRWGFIGTLWVSAFGRVAAGILFGIIFFHPRIKLPVLNNK